MLLGQDVGPVTHVQRADALRPLELVGAQREQVGPEGRDVDLEIRCRLDRIHVEQHAGPGMDAGRDLGDRLDRADLVVGQHHRHEDGPIGEGCLDLLRIDASVAIDGELDDLEPELLERPQRVTHGVMLDR